MFSTQPSLALIISVISLPFLQVVSGNIIGTCNTPTNHSGMCTALHECEPLNQIYLNWDNVTATEITFLQESQCGMINNVPFVCCPEQQKFKLLPSPSSHLCGIQTKPRIMGGNVTEIGEFPWAVLLIYEKVKFKCGGSLINNRYILTAAHCVHSSKTVTVGELTHIRVGEWDYDQETDCVVVGKRYCSPDPIDVPVEQIIIHPAYDSNAFLGASANDIALVRLNTIVEFNYFVKPICLPITDNLRNINYNGTKFTVTGWGKTEKSVFGSSKKMKLEMTGYGHSDCVKAWMQEESRIGRALRETHICAGSEAGRDTCYGDSGGPLMAMDLTQTPPIYYQSGIVSFGLYCGIDELPSVYTKVSEYLEWIDSNLKP